MGEALWRDRRLNESDIPIPGKYLHSKWMLDQTDMLYTCFGIWAPFCAARQSCGLCLGPGYILPLSRAGMMLTEMVFHFSKRKREELEADHDPLLPKTSIFSTESRALYPVYGDSWRLEIVASLSSSPMSLPAETREAKMLCYIFLMWGGEGEWAKHIQETICKEFQ